jgi:hypothetical protein
MLDKVTIANLLTALGKQIEFMKKGPIQIVVCGGASMNVLGQINRTTRDIDVLGILKREKSGKLKTEEAVFPSWFIEATNRVKKDFDLPDNWINTEPTSLVRLGLPKGFESRLKKIRYSRSFSVCFISRLDQIHFKLSFSVCFISRLDQIHFKLYASADRGGHHINDLLLLSPKDEEIKQAARWCMTHDVSAGFRLVLMELLKELGFLKTDESI